MANVNFNKMAMQNLGYGIADLRNPERRAEIKAEAERLRAAAKTSGSGTQLRQADIAKALDTFPGFRDATMYGPTVAALAAHLTEYSESPVSPNRVVQHLAKMRSEGIIDSAPMMETSGKRGRPPVFFFLTDAERFEAVLSGEYTAKG